MVARLTLVVPALVAAVLACGRETTGTDRIAKCESPGANTVTIQNFGFHPQTLRVSTGTRVTWVNCEPAGREAHTSTSDAGAWESPFMTRGQEFSHTFDQAGRHDYHCVPHPEMQGVVIVE